MVFLSKVAALEKDSGVGGGGVLTQLEHNTAVVVVAGKRQGRL